MKHTKGELKVSSSFLIVDKDARIIANVEPIGIPGITTTYEEGDANAKELVRRWNSQPDLLAACEDFVEAAKWDKREFAYIISDFHHSQIRKAIKKAK